MYLASIAQEIDPCRLRLQKHNESVFRGSPHGVWLALIISLAFGALALGGSGRPASYRAAQGTGACETPACAGHEAGWRWASRRGIHDPDRCGGRSPSFVKGCRAYAEGGE
jgi:hypothetical protein